MGTLLFFFFSRRKENASPILHPKMKQIIIGPGVMLPGTWEAGMSGRSGGKRVVGTDCGGSVKAELGQKWPLHLYSKE